MYKAEHRSGKGEKCHGGWVSDRGACSVMAKLKLVSVWVKRGKRDLESENEKTEKRRMKKDRNPKRRE